MSESRSERLLALAERVQVGNGRDIALESEIAPLLAHAVLPPATVSLDVVHSLIGDHLPGWTWRLTDYPNGPGGRHLYVALVYTAKQEAGSDGAKSPARALLAALLRALAAKGDA